MIDIYRSGGPQIIVAIFVVAIGLFVLRRVHQKTVKGLTPRQTVPAMGSSPAVVRSLSAIDRCTHAIAQGNWGFYAIVLVVFTGMNLASFGFDIANSHSLRNSPNIILIQIDTLRADRLGCYGYQRKTSPNIDKLASESMRFEKAISPAPWTTASVAQYMTSKYLRTVRFEMPYSGIPANAVSIAGALKDHGYSTAGVNSNLLAGSKRGFARGFDTYDESVYDEISSPYVFSTAVKRLNALKNKKFFMFLLFMDVHSPYELHENHNFYPDYKGKLGKRVEVKFDDDANQYSKDDLKYLSALYDSEIAYTDEYIGKLMDELKKLNLYNDTLIILLSDHGEEFGEHGGMEHGKRLYDEALSVPLIIKLPGQHKGSVVGGTFPLMDLYPSIMDAVHLSTSSFNLDGIASHLQGLRKSDERDIYAATNFGFTDKSCIRTNSYKLIDDKLTSKQELFSLVLDPAETKNVLKSEPSLAGILTNRLKGKDQEIDKTIPSRSPSIAEPKADSADDSAKLRSLGYLH
jgi:arylsulfatase A-like enzyme